MVDLDRLSRLMAKDEDFLDGWFTTAELAEIEERGRRLEGVGGRVAAKEACVKALGTGFSGDVSWHDVEVRSPGDRPPELVLSAGALDAAARLGIGRLLLSISHTGSVAMASVIAVAEEHHTIPK